jgi:hypothetical protein
VVAAYPYCHGEGARWWKGGCCEHSGVQAPVLPGNCCETPEVKATGGDCCHAPDSQEAAHRDGTWNPIAGV